MILSKISAVYGVEKPETPQAFVLNVGHLTTAFLF